MAESDRISEPERIARLTDLRRRNRAVPSAYLAAQELVKLRGDFGDWCWLAWHAHNRGEYSKATHALRRALELHPGHER